MLLAKPPKGDRRVTLPAHTQKVMDFAERIAKIYGVDMVYFWKLPVSPNRLKEILLATAWIHDFGKATDHFQPYIRDERPNFNRNPQALRHETISLWLAHQPFLRDALEKQFSNGERLAILAAVASHHSKEFDARKRAEVIANPACRTTIDIDSADQDFVQLLDLCPFPIGKKVQPLSLEVSYGDFSAVQRLYDSGNSKVQPHPQGLNVQWRNLIGCLKSCLIAADVFASISDDRYLNGTPDMVEELLSRWGRRVLEKHDHDEIIGRDVAGITQGTGGKYVQESFQIACGKSRKMVTLLVQGCGAGKTHAGNLWAQKHAKGRRLFVCYPTRDTATTAYHNTDVELSGLIHGLVSGPEFDDEKAQQELAQETVEALWLWDSPRVYCTVDTVLGMFTQYRRSTLLAPCIANSAFIFDEVHTYDSRLFAALLRFLKDFRAPSLLMTATLTQDREDRIRENAVELAVIKEERREESEHRYFNITSKDPDCDYLKMLSTPAFQKSTKSLFVVNTVGRAIALADAIQAQTNKKVVCYHSRYPYIRREEIRRQMVDEMFNRNYEEPAIAVATQTVQVSLDISCDVMFTELAPVCDLIQRLGRLNRWGGQMGLFAVLDPPHHAPYRKDDLEIARQWLKRLPYARQMSQAELVHALHQMNIVDEPTKHSLEHSLLDKFDSSIGRIREETASIDVVLSRHLERAKKDLGKYTIRMTLPWQTDPEIGRKVLVPFWTWQKVGYAYVPPDDKITYSDERGAEWS